MKGTIIVPVVVMGMRYQINSSVAKSYEDHPRYFQFKFQVYLFATKKNSFK